MNLLVEILRRLHVPYTFFWAEKQYGEHPYRDSLYGLSQLLKSYGVANQGFRLADKTCIDTLPLPFVAHFAGDFILVTRNESGNITFKWKGGDITLQKTQFFEKWDGVVLICERQADSGEPDYPLHRRKSLARVVINLLTLFCVATLLIIYLVTHLADYTRATTVSWVLYGAGAYVSFGLLRQQLDRESQVAQRLCSLFGQSSCNEVTESAAARLFGLLSWSEIGFGYFAGALAAALFCKEAEGPLTIVSLCALPYTLWSVWYQWQRVGQWCVLCLLVQALLWMQACCWVALAGLPGLPPRPFAFFPVGLLLAAGILLTHQTVRVLKSAFALPYWKHSCRRLKADSAVFEALQARQTARPDGPEATSLSFGPADATHVLTVFSNPYCDPCARLHARLKHLKGRDLRIQYIFTAFKPEMEDVNRLLIAAYQQLGPGAAYEIFNQWYAGGKERQAAFFQPWQLDSDTPETDAEMARHANWKAHTGLHATPTLIFDGRELSKEYQVEDLADLL